MSLWPWKQPDATPEVIEDLLSIDDGIADGYIIGTEEIDNLYYVKVVLAERTIDDLVTRVVAAVSSPGERK